MDINTLIIILVGAVVVFLLLRKQKPHGEAVLLQNQIQEVVRTLDSKLGDSTKQMQSQFEGSARIIRDVTERLTKLDETNKQVINFLDQLLKNVMPPGSFELQYKFPDGVIVDAAVFVKDKIIPVDAKFSLENYN